MVSMIYYKIRLKNEPDKYVKGTPAYLGYDQVGRIFQKIGQLRSFITQVMNRSRGSPIDLSTWEVVELEMVVKQTKNVHELMSTKKIIELLKK